MLFGIVVSLLPSDLDGPSWEVCISDVCCEGSCNGRGPRTAAWFKDYLEQKGDTSMQSLILEGGIKGWVKAGPEYTELMEEFDASKW